MLAAQAAVASRAAAADVSQRLQTGSRSHPRDAQAWQLLASAYAAQGQTLRAIRAEAEAQVAHLDYEAALDRFKAAQDLARRSGAVPSTTSRRRSSTPARARWSHFFANRRSSADSITRPAANRSASRSAPRRSRCTWKPSSTLAGRPEHQRVDDEQEQPQRDHRDRQRQHHQDRPHHRVEQPDHEAPPAAPS